MGIHESEAEVMRRRALEFLDEAHQALKTKHFTLSCFLSEQAVQLHLKWALLKSVGDYPRRHELRELLGELSKDASSKELKTFVSRNRARISSLEDAYIMARYSSKEYSREDAADALKLARGIIRLTRRVRRPTK